MAALNKRWLGTAATVTTGTAVYTTATNWAPINLTKPIYKWTQSPATATEFYLELVGGGDPGISAPGAVYINSAAATEGTVGALTAGQWDYGDNDTLGYSTVYVRITGDGDPDAQVIGYVQMYQIPVATDHVRIAAGSGNITGIDQSAVAIGDFIVEDGYTGTIGSVAQPLIIDPNLFEFLGGGRSYIDLFSANIAPDIRKTAAAGAGLMGLYLKGSNLTTVTVYSGTVGIGFLHGDTATVATVRVMGGNANVYLGKNVSLTTSYISKGKIYQHCACTTANVFGGLFQTEEQGAITTINADLAAKLILNSTGTVGTLNMQAGFTGLVDMLQSAEARTITTLAHKSGHIQLDRSVVTVTTYTVGDSKPQKVAITAA